MRTMSIILACMSMLCSGMDDQKGPFAFFGKQKLRLRDLQIQEEELKDNPIPALLEKRKGVAGIYQSSLAHMLDIPADYFPDGQQALSQFPRDPDVVVCYTKMFPHDRKAAAIGLVTYRFSRLLKSIDEAGGPELAVLVGQGESEKIDSSLSLMLDVVRLRLAVKAAQGHVSLSSGEIEEDELDSSPIPMRVFKRSASLYPEVISQKVALVDNSDLISFIAQLKPAFWGNANK